VKLSEILDWLGFGEAGHAHRQTSYRHNHAAAGAGHGHTHGVVDPSIATSDRGIWAIKWSFVILAITAAVQMTVVILSGSVALLADTIHNIGDATTAIPLWVAFTLVKRKPTRTFNYGLGRVEDLAGILIVLIILFSAIVAGYEAVSRLVHPQPLAQLGWVAAAGVVGFIGNEVVAVFRIRTGREIDSAALIADGYHARTDGLTSLAVVVGAIGVWLGFPLADPIIGLVITLAIFGIVWQSARAVMTRSLDGVDPVVVDEVRHAASHVHGLRIVDVRCRWLGHRLHTDVAVAVDGKKTVEEASYLASTLRTELLAHIPALRTATVTFATPGDASVFDITASTDPAPHHHAQEPIEVNSALVKGTLTIVDTPDGERMRFISDHARGLTASVVIERPAGRETLHLLRKPGHFGVFESAVAPAEPHEFDATLLLSIGGHEDEVHFQMTEPVGHAN
jgi:cation diffusion facilitator family transporter